MFPPEPFQRGDMVGECQIEKLIAVAGCGFVYRGRDPHGSVVAVKAARPDANYLRFDIEAAVGQRLNNHHAIVKALRSGRHNGIPYIVFEYITFPTLSMWRKHLNPNRFDEGVILHTARELSGALVYAYEHTGIVAHRDVKPGNIFLDMQRLPHPGSVKLSDFGVAKKIDSELTGALEFIGVAPYLAPEIVLNQAYSEHSDMFSLGIVLYLMAAGSFPFPVDNTRDISIVARYINEELPHVRSRRPDLSEDTGEMIMGCLRREPSQRHSSMRSLHSRLGGIAVSSRDRIAMTPPVMATRDQPEVFIDDSDPQALFAQVDGDSDGADWGAILGFAGGAVLLFIAMMLLILCVALPNVDRVITWVIAIFGAFCALSGFGVLLFTGIRKLKRAREPKYRNLDDLYQEVLRSLA